MLVARGLGRPGGIFVTGGLGAYRVLVDEQGLWVMTDLGWQLATELYVRASDSWQQPDEVFVYTEFGWASIWRR